MPHDPFIGTWILDPTSCDYQYSTPPQSGMYRISVTEHGYHFDVAWVDAAGTAQQTAFDGIPDGVQYPYDNPQIADAVSFTRVDERTLDSATFKGGAQIAHARRVLEGDRMTVTQSITTPDGQTLRNVAVYLRV